MCCCLSKLTRPSGVQAAAGVHILSSMAKDNPDEGEAPIIVGMAEAAMHMYVTAIDALPDNDDDEFRPRVEVILTGLRKLRKTLTDAAARNRLTPRVIVAL